ncbi:hypothetical protein AFCA_011707 [Aspergillus flavus]|nr:uncharacterized protein G4B84_010858 [Aspergillus flavus NRRL3357]KAF7624366.1 hypothetical protein AFLA_008076 [Aspergillus flavus NRRL3357]QMW35367.1 hypothetical protein G4B84_010858 [Aspergillus flavus NRRL3357]QMW47429.1 hypothetical protein G4B11_010908 [Aspergillus flavus]UDD64470.1 hypothetical protein AFCA_011707 [Aspergillus flavus]
MGWFSDDSDQADAYNQVTHSPHKAELSHELLGAAAAYEAQKAYEKHCSENGKPDSHAEAKELMAGFAGAFLDRVIETKGLDYIDKKKAGHEAQNHLDELVADDNY